MRATLALPTKQVYDWEAGAVKGEFLTPGDAASGGEQRGLDPSQETFTARSGLPLFTGQTDRPLKSPPTPNPRHKQGGISNKDVVLVLLSSADPPAVRLLFSR